MPAIVANNDRNPKYFNGESAIPDQDTRPGLILPERDQMSRLFNLGNFNDYYRSEDVPLFSGQSASVYKCKQIRTGQEFIAKICGKTRDGLDFSYEVLHEVAVMLRCRSCPKIVRLQEVFETKNDFIMVMEFCCGGDFQAVLDSNQVPYECDVIQYVINILQAVQYLHDNRIAHLDIKPQNIVLVSAFPDSEVKLCDLEISREILPGRSVREMLGTPDYVAPEILRFEEITPAADIWSIGVLVYVLLTGFTPFGGDTDAETFRNISLAQVDFPDELFEDISDAAKDWISRCLALRPECRPSASELLNHPWLQAPVNSITYSAVASEHGSSLSIASNACSDSRSAATTLQRSISKSREVIFERAKHSQLRKCLSKSRERLCDRRLGLSTSAERVTHINPIITATRSQVEEQSSESIPCRLTGIESSRASNSSSESNSSDKMGSFRARDQHQHQASSCLAGVGIGGTSSGLSHGPAPFVRQCSLRGRRRSNVENRDSAAGTTSTVSPIGTTYNCPKKNNTKDKEKLQQNGESRQGFTEESRQTPLADNNEAQSVCPEKRKQSRKEISTPNNDKNFIIVEIVSDDEHEDVFTRLYRESFRDPDLKMRKLREGEYNEEEGSRSRSSTRRARKELSRSPESPDIVHEQAFRHQARNNRLLPTVLATSPRDDGGTGDHSMSSVSVINGQNVSHTSSSESVNDQDAKLDHRQKLKPIKKKSIGVKTNSNHVNGHTDSAAHMNGVKHGVKVEPKRRTKHQSSATEKVPTADKSTSTDPSLLASLLHELVGWQNHDCPSLSDDETKLSANQVQENPSAELQSASVAVLRHIFESQSLI